MGAGIIILLIGLFITICTLAKPSFYWENRKALRLRRLVGDGITTILYLIIGILCIGISIANFLGIVSL